MRLLQFCFIIIFLFASTAIGDSSVTLAWDPNDPSPEGYRIFMRTEGSIYNYGAFEWEGTTTTATVDNIPDGSTVYFVVRAYSGEDESGDSNEVEFVAAAGPVTKTTPGNVRFTQ